MLDFFTIGVKEGRHGLVEIYPIFKVTRSKDLMVRGSAFYAVWDEAVGLWSTDEYDVARLIDQELFAHAAKLKEAYPSSNIVVRSMSEFSSDNKSWQTFKQFMKSISDNSHQLDRKLTFADTKVKRTDYVSKRLPYSMEECDIPAYEEIMSKLYSKEERDKLEWAIGAIISGDSKKIQKFIVLYGKAGTGKSTILNIIQMLFDGYYGLFEAKALGSNNNAFATEVFRSNPLVAIQHDGDLSKIEDNSKLNSIISHEEMVMNEKFKSSYSSKIDSFLFMGTNKPVKITDSKSGIIRRLIDVKPTGEKISVVRYNKLMKAVEYELGGIAAHCLQLYSDLGKDYYSDYKPIDMMFQTDVFFNFVEHYSDIFEQDGQVTLKRAYTMYNQYCEETLVEYRMPQYRFREELKNYFDDYIDRKMIDGERCYGLYSGFKVERFCSNAERKKDEEGYSLEHTSSLFDDVCGECPAQYANDSEFPMYKWENVTTKLKDIDTTRLHYVMVPKNHIVIDFDLKDEKGEKSKKLNLEAASKWPETYGEFSKGGAGVHLHYIYDGDVDQLSRVYSDGIEVKIFTGNSSLRRRLSKCNDKPIAKISSGLPLKKKKVVDFDAIKSENGIRSLIKKNIRKEVHPGTKPSIDFIFKILEDAYASGMHYDVSDLRQKVMVFANNSSHHAEYCIDIVSKMHFKSDDVRDNVEVTDASDDGIIFFDVEVFPNLFLINWKPKGNVPCVRMINPTPEEVGKLMEHKLVGFNCRRYDNHILYARYLGYSNMELYKLSMRIISGNGSAMFSEAYNLSFTDVLDFSSKKQSLKKFEIELGIHHQELGLPWDQPVDESLWEKVAEYCDNDVIATEAVFEARSADWTARQILADVAGMTVNDTTNSLTTRIIFGKNRKPQDQFNYRDMGKETGSEDIWSGSKTNHTMFRDGKPIFPGYSFDDGKSSYRGEDVGEGGYVYAEPGIYHDVALLDIASMHPSSIVAENLFGDEYTKRFKDILDSRILIKHKEFDKAKTMMDGKLAPYLDDTSKAKDLAQALKIAINSVYGLTSAKFDNPFRDRRNIDNIVAKRGALFMINLKHEVQDRGFVVAHIKTDSIKIPNATPEIISFVQEYGRMYGYNFEHEATYDRMCLVNDAVYIAKYKDGDWTATGVQFQQPYVFKTLFTNEPIEFKDVCETKTVTSSMYLDMNEDNEDDHRYSFVGKAGLFCPIVKGAGGGLLMREKDGKYYAVTGTKGYRWLESEVVERLGIQDKVDISYYRSFVDDAVESIKKYGDFDEFVYGGPRIPPTPSLPPCGDNKYFTCFECPAYIEGKCSNGYNLENYIYERK